MNIHLFLHLMNRFYYRDVQLSARMYEKLIFCFILVSVQGELVNFHYSNSYKYGVTYAVTVDKANEYILEFGGNNQTYDTPARVSVASDYASASYPVFITARQQKGVLSWQLPMRVETPQTVEEFTNISRTLCPHNNLFVRDDDCEARSLSTPIIHLTTSNPNPTRVYIRIEAVKDFYIKLNDDAKDGNISTLNHTYALTINPTRPMYYFYSFNRHANLSLDVLKLQNKYACSHPLSSEEQERAEWMTHQSGNADWLQRQDGVLNVSDQPSDETGSWFWRPNSVILMIESDSDVCAVISIQNFSCPVFDNERDILYDGQYLTMTRAGGITLTQEQFPLGFYIVFIVKASDEDCGSKLNDNATSGLLLSTNEARVYNTDGRSKNFRFAVIATISYREYAVAAGATLVFFLSFYLVYFVSLCACRRKLAGERLAEVGEVQSESPESSSSAAAGDLNSQDMKRTTSTTAEASEDSDSDLSVLADLDTDKNVYILPSRLRVASLSKARLKVLKARSNLYTWSVLTVAVFYTLPVVQLVVTYQPLMRASGNQDLCYYNFLCAHPLGFLQDFNHVYSNIGYVLLGLLFVLQVYVRHRAEIGESEQKELGIPQHYGLLYAMGIALICEGLLSASYHVCPNSMNFQFDTSFMYVTAALCMVKIYQSRHPDINARAHSTFGVLAVIMAIGVFGIMNSSTYFWAFFTIIHIATCFILTFKIYYLGRFRYDPKMLYQTAKELVRTPMIAVTPIYCGRMVLLLAVNLVNWAIAAYGVYQHQKDFASHLLVVMMSNLFLYTNFYVVMKLLHKEKIEARAWIFFVSMHVVWYTGAYFFLQENTNWAVSPAASRQYNSMCALLQLYDAHDIWHLLSAVAMFLSFNMYLAIDDNLRLTPRTHIMVF